MSNYKPFAFVLMPFDSKFSDIYRYGIKQAAEESGVIAERVDEQNFSETILERIYRQIENSDFIIAEMTGKNPNVFYEVGYAHAIHKLCALITQSADDIPFDLKHHTHVIYDGSIDNLKSQIIPKIQWMKEETDKKKSKIIAVDIEADSGFLRKGEYAHYGTFNLKINLKNISTRRSPEIEAIYITTSKNWELSIDGIEIPNNPDTTGSQKKSVIVPRLKRLAPSAFSQEKIHFERMLWTKYNGSEEKNEYTMKGMIPLEIVTSEGILQYEFSLEVTFDEIPF